MIRAILLSFCVCVGACGAAAFGAEPGTLQAGAAVVDITPTKLPVPLRGNFFAKPTDEILDPIFARSLVLYDGREYVVFLVVDCCTIPRPLAEAIKAIVVKKTGIPRERIMLSATHTHSAPALLVKPRAGETNHTIENVAAATEAAVKKLAPAKIGWAVGNDPNNVFCRRFLMKKGTAKTNPFSDKRDDRAQMNPGPNNPNAIARTGPVDTAVSVVSVLSPDDKPIAVLANYSTHYAGGIGNKISADYFGVFHWEIRRLISERIGKNNMPEDFVAIMTNGTSGDANSNDYLNPSRKSDLYTVGRDVAKAAMTVWPNIEYFDRIPIRMTERTMTLANRVPSPEEVQASKEHLASLPGGEPKTIPDVYARYNVNPKNWSKTTEVVIQAIRIGELGLTALPGEIYGITGLEIKARSPLWPTINIGMANSHAGYVPTPEQHALGGYNTWRAPTRCLEVEAEPKIKAAAIELLKTLHDAE